MGSSERLAVPWDSSPAPGHSADDVREVLKDFTRYREKFLKIRPREGGERRSFIINAAQQVLHQRLQWELETFGRIRALIPKARRMGVSTYIGGRFFHRSVSKKGTRAHVVAHRSDSASNLFREVKLFYEMLPKPWQPSLSTSNARELIFDKLQSVYKVSSAEGGNIGRSDDTHLLHMSEAAFFDNTEDLSSGIMQTVLDQPETEIAMESTGNGASGMFFNMCEQASREKNTGMWRLHFLPWTVMPEYAHAPPEKWTPPQEFLDYARLHSMTPAQLYWFWRQNSTIASMNGGQPDAIHRLTRQEYPATYLECFSTDSTLDFFPASLVQSAMLSTFAPTLGALKILSVDPAGDGVDECFVCDRQGGAVGTRVWGAIKSNDQNVQADWIVQTYQRFGLDVILIETDGVGKGLLDAVRLRMGTRAERVVAVHRGSGARNSVQFGNLRAELHFKASLWLQGSARMPNDKMLQEEFAAFKWGSGGCRRDELGRLFITPKEKLRAELPGNRSPNRLDCVVNSFAIDDYALSGGTK
jgi:hypothetical protein